MECRVALPGLLVILPWTVIAVRGFVHPKRDGAERLAVKIDGNLLVDLSWWAACSDLGSLGTLSPTCACRRCR